MQYKVLTIAGFDGSGGAGLQADLKTFSAFGCYGMSVLTALPIQNTCGVRNCYEIPLPSILDQLQAIFDDIVPNAIKIGMLFNTQIITVVAEFLKHHALDIPIVLDPVIVAKSGDHLLLPQAVDTLKHQLIPLATLITPNINEAQHLTNLKIHSQADMLQAGNAILNLGCDAVLVKGGHMEYSGTTCDDLLLSKELQHWLNAPKVATTNTHGTGCTLSAAIASCLAMGFTLTESCKIAKRYITQALIAVQKESVGHGHGPVHHFYHLWPTIDLLIKGNN